MASTKLIVRVLKARGHGVHGLFPHEEAWVEVWVASDTTTSNTVETQKRKGHPLVWNEEYELDIAVGQAEHGQGQGQAAVHVKFRGKMAGHEAIDDIGEGVCGIEEALQGTVSIPLHSPTGKEAGYLELFVKREV